MEQVHREKGIGKILLACVVLLLFGSLLAAYFIPENRSKLTFAVAKSFADGWENVETKETVAGEDTLLEKGEVFCVKKNLPDDLNEESAIAFYNRRFYITVYIEDEKVFESGAPEELRFGNEQGKVWNTVGLSASDSGKEMKIRVENFGQAEYFDMDTVAIGAENDLNIFILQRSTPNVIQILIALCFAVFFIAFYYLMCRYHVEKNRRAIFLMIFLTIDCSVWFFTDSTMITYLTEHSAARYVLYFVSFFLMPVLVLLLLKEIFLYGRKVLGRLLDFYLVFLLVVWLLYLTGVVHISVSVNAVDLVMIVLAVAMTVVSVQEYRIVRDKMILGEAVAFIILAVSGVLTMIRLYNRTPDTLLFFRYAFLVFLLIFSMTLVRESMTEVKDIASAEHYKILAYTDPVTGGNSATKFEEELELRKEEDGYWLIHMNFLNFKVVNEMIGWEMGSELLKEIYEALEALSAPDEVQCNLGGASFLLLVRCGDDMEALHERCRDIKNATKKCMQELPLRVRVQTRFCICEVKSQEDENLQMLLDHALMAYRNPRAEHWTDVDSYIYNEECSNQLLFEKKVESRLDTALRNHEFEMYLQPKVNPATKKVEGAEALVRWNSPDGMIRPDQFIPVLEKKGMISKVDSYMFREVCELLCKWEREGRELIVISVNVSKSGINVDEILESYWRILRETGAPAEYIELEFTESVAYEDYANLQRTLSWIHRKGGRCSMDDFGSSYSNLKAIQTLDFDTVKLDKCFFDNGGVEEPRGKEMICGLIRMFKSLGIEIVAEGIETEEQVNALRSMDCDLIQGYYYSKPVPVQEFEQFQEKISKEE